MLRKFLFRILLIFLLLPASGAFSQSFLPVCANFGIEDYNEDVEFRCAASDYKGTTYFGTNFGVLLFKGEKKSRDKSWEFILLPDPEIVLSMYMDTTAKRLYVGAQNDFGYFDLSVFNNPEFISLKEKLPPSYKESIETWHVNRVGQHIVFHTIRGLFVYDGADRFSIIAAPEGGIFHNVFMVNNKLLINSLDKGWFTYGEKLEPVELTLPWPVDKCYAVLPSLKKDVYNFFFRNAGVYEAVVNGASLKKVNKISSPGFDQILSESQLYGAELNADKTKIIIATLNKGALIVNNDMVLEATAVLSETSAATNILSSYGLYTDPLKNTWILGKSNLSRLPSDLSLVYKDFRGITVKSLAVINNKLIVAATNGLFTLDLEASSTAGLKKIREGSFARVIAKNDTAYTCTPTGEVLRITAENSESRVPTAEINALSFFNGKPCFASSDGIFPGFDHLGGKHPLEGNNCLQLVQVNNLLYVLIEDYGIVELDENYKVTHEYKLNKEFTATQNAKLFSENGHLIISNLLNTFCIKNNAISVLSKSDITRIWMDKQLSNGDQVEFEFDKHNNTSIKLKQVNDTVFRLANSFMSLVDVNDAEYFEGKYYLATKNGLYVSSLISEKTEELINIFKVGTDSTTYSVNESIAIPYSESKTINVFCALNSFYNTFDNTTYSYRLDTDGERWTNTPFSNFSLNKLPWGEHTLEIKADYGNGQESGTAVLHFTILKPWWATWGALILWVLIVVIFIYIIVQISVYRLKQSKIKLEQVVKERTAEIVTQKNEIEGQKEEIEYKNREITDSINYAQRIQNSLLKGEEKLLSTLPGAFVLYLPKDIVSGDFYWFTTIEHYQVIVVADCTGHGVPGAFMSMLGVSKLNELAARNIYRPDKLLHELNRLIVETLGQNLSNSDSRDGMDAVVICIDRKTNKLYYSGANRPLLMVNTKDKSFSELKATKLPVGGGQYGENRDYQLHELELSHELMVYLGTDGFADQFGGSKGKKFMTKQLNELLLEIAHLDTKAQKEKLKESYLSWKSNYEQVDDVCMIGIRL